MYAKANGTAGSMDLYFSSDRAQYEADTSDLVIRGNGNVGIGSDNPQAKLDVAGDIKIVENSPRLEFHDANAANNTACTGGIEIYDSAGNRGAFMGATEGTGILSFGLSSSAGSAPQKNFVYLPMVL